MLAGAKSFVSGQGLGPKGLIGGWGFGKGQPAPLLQLGDLGSAVSWNPSQNRIWCVLVLNYDIWWQEFQ